MTPVSQLLVTVLLAAIAAMTFLAFGMLGLPVVVVLVLWLAVVPERIAAIGVALVAAGAGALALILAANARCGNGCMAPDLLPFNLAALVLVAIGIVLIVWRLRTGSLAR